ncbi:MAG: hydroxymethylbilane synthase [Bacteroidota bacterium]
MDRTIRIGTRESQLAVWQAVTVQKALQKNGIQSQLVFIKSEGDTNQVTPLYAMGVQGVFTKALDAALLGNEIDIAVHSMKDVPVQLAQGIAQAAVLERGHTADMFVWNDSRFTETENQLVLSPATPAREIISAGMGGEIWTSQQCRQCHGFILATSSIRRKAQWLHHFPGSVIEDIRGNINTRMQKTQAHNYWHGAMFAAAGLERIGLQAGYKTTLKWMLPAPAQGAIVVVCRTGDEPIKQSMQRLNHTDTALCVKAERDFLKTLMGGCSTPISALATRIDDKLIFEGNITETNGKGSISISLNSNIADAAETGTKAATLLLENGAKSFMDSSVLKAT